MPLPGPEAEEARERSDWRWLGVRLEELVFRSVEAEPGRVTEAESALWWPEVVEGPA